MNTLPDSVSRRIDDTTRSALQSSLRVAVSTMNNERFMRPSYALAAEGAPAIVRLISKVATRFSVPVSEKFAAQAVPAIGAAGGAAINLVFINHFQDMARGHFTARRLERKHGAEVIQREYKKISQGKLS